MSTFVPEKEHLRHALLFLFHQKKNAAESCRLLAEIYCEHAPSIRTCETWFRQFKRGDFNVEDSARSGRPKKYEDEETVNAQQYRQQMINLNHSLIERRPEWARRHGKVILLHDNAPSHTAKPVKDTLKSLGWDILPHPLYSPDLAPSDYHLFASMGHALAEQHFRDFEEIGKWIDEWIATKDKQFFWNGIHNLPERWSKCVEADGQYFE